MNRSKAFCDVKSNGELQGFIDYLFFHFLNFFEFRANFRVSEKIRQIAKRRNLAPFLRLMPILEQNL